MKLHPLCEVFPPLNKERLQSLGNSIKINGLRDPIILYNEQVLDGRNRLQACELVGVEPRFETYNGNDPLGLVIDKNLERRDLTEGQRALIAAKIMNIQHGGDRRSNKIKRSTDGVTQLDAARQMKVGEASVGRARQLIKSGKQELIQAVQSGEMKLRTALRHASDEPPKPKDPPLVRALDIARQLTNLRESLNKIINSIDKDKLDKGKRSMIYIELHALSVTIHHAMKIVSPPPELVKGVEQ
jgi:hypothetical protein